MKVVLLSENAKMPTRATTEAAGYDLYASVSCTVEAYGLKSVALDIALQIPHGYYGRIAPRSSLAAKFHIDVGAGVVDSDYRGPVAVVLFNHADEAFQVDQGMRIAQLIITPCHTPELTQVETLDDTDRGSGGFGSTGVY